MVKEKFQVDATDGEGYDEAVKGLMQQNGLGKICPSTIYHWMKLLGFKYDQEKKLIMLMVVKSHQRWNIKTVLL
jgi:hypothetical protein